MKKLLLVLLLIITITVGNSQNIVFKYICDSSEIIANVQVLKFDLQPFGEDGTLEYIVLAEIITSYKGRFKTKEKICFGMHRFNFLRDNKEGGQFEEKPKLEKGKPVIIFLSGNNGKKRFLNDPNMYTEYKLTDRWLGIQSYEAYLDDYLKKIK